MKNRKILVFLPCYNEELNITDLIEEWNKHEKSLKIKALFLKYMELMTVVKIRLKIKY